MSDNYPSGYREPPSFEEVMKASDDKIYELAHLVTKLRKGLFMCAAHCQGGHSDAGAAAADLLNVPFPVRMGGLEARAIIDGFDPDELWPWLRKMKNARAALRTDEAAQ